MLMLSGIEILDPVQFLANVNSRSRSLYAIARPSVVCQSSVVCNVRAPYSGGTNFRQYFYGARYTLAIRWHPLKISRRSSQGNLSAGELSDQANRLGLWVRR